MPRHSAESRSAASWRAKSAHPTAPSYLSRDAKKLWREIVGARPVDYFQPGSLQLLEQFCETFVAQRVALAAMAQCADDPDALALAVQTMKNLSLVVNGTAQKLRISIQAEVDRRSFKLDEKEPAVSASELLGSGVVRLPRRRA